MTGWEAMALESAEKRQMAFKRAADRDLGRGCDGQTAAEADNAFAAVRSTDLSLGAAQDALDGALALTGAPLHLWHHYYRDNCLPRHDYCFDFADRRKAVLRWVHHELRTGWIR